MTLHSEYFDKLYENDRDPWRFRTRWYEERKRRLTMAALPRERYGSVFEPGCSIGLLTCEMAARCDRLLAMDISAKALEQLAVDPPANTLLLTGAVPEDWPDGTFDLVVLSEVGYYLDHVDCRRLAELAVTTAKELIAVHWRHPVDDYPLTGDEVHEHIRVTAEQAGWTRLAAHMETDLRIDVWSQDQRSVAAQTGLVPNPVDQP